MLIFSDIIVTHEAIASVHRSVLSIDLGLMENLVICFRMIWSKLGLPEI